MPSWLSSALDRTVWSSAAVTLDNWSDRWERRAFMPIYCVIAILGGVAAVAWGSPTLNEMLDPLPVDLFGYGFILTAGCSLIGCVIPKFWALEVAGLIALFGLMAVYITAIVTTQPHHWSQAFVVLVVGLSMIMPLSRLVAIGGSLMDRVDK